MMVHKKVSTVKGKFIIKGYRGGKLIEYRESPNAVVGDGIDAMLGATVAGSAYPGPWYIGAARTSGGAFDSDFNDTMASHSGWLESNIFEERPQWHNGVSAGGVVSGTTSPTTVSSNLHAIQGLFITNVSTPQSSAGKLWAVTTISPTISVGVNDVYVIFYETTLTPDGNP